ncbi:hypothetical protein BCR37DRAFT_2050 [Protomyces lactucae-debilis]|uniref:Zn(2)-C6 fungal-type domain-containing protein n=1 Tax=Protomyces lactucae-debilis TaxID=2754530 RepID=A0A1Y2FUB3_PROLT|nr:uncharacterized protein BCR37DRAFT_2050 [Protomyces lactucae-debilis]ORY87603.1 hypothetical protein BCR37DRAFT_2050 [Protomyces lactucae-debilis]
MVKDTCKLAGRKAPRTKSGCWTCRERKVKCDEQKPICSTCSRLGLECAGYTSRIAFRDDTPRVVTRMKDVTDVSGCDVYDQRASRRRSTSRHSPNLRYKTYTPEYFETYRDIALDDAQQDESSGDGPPSPGATEKRLCPLSEPFHE